MDQELYQEETGQSIFVSLKEYDVFPDALPGTWEELDGELQKQFTGFADELNAQRLLHVLHEAVDQVPGLGDECQHKHSPRRVKVTGLAEDEDEEYKDVVFVTFVDGQGDGAFPVRRKNLVRVAPVEEEEGVA